MGLDGMISDVINYGVNCFFLNPSELLSCTTGRFQTRSDSTTAPGLGFDPSCSECFGELTACAYAECTLPCDIIGTLSLRQIECVTECALTTCGVRFNSCAGGECYSHFAQQEDSEKPCRSTTCADPSFPVLEQHLEPDMGNTCHGSSHNLSVWACPTGCVEVVDAFAEPPWCKVSPPPPPPPPPFSSACLSANLSATTTRQLAQTTDELRCLISSAVQAQADLSIELDPSVRYRLNGTQLECGAAIHLHIFSGEGGATIDAEGRSRILDVSGGCTLSLSNLSLVNGRAGFSLEECSLDTEAQTLNMLASMPPAGCDGGALLATLSSSELVTADAVSISRTKFENCSAKGRGGAVQILYEDPFGGDVTMDGASFDGCSSGSGASGVCRDCSRTSRKPV